MDTPFLLVVSPDGATTRIDVEAEVVLGRDSDVASLRQDTELSRRHARVVHTGDDSLTIEDLGSANGTFVDGTPIDGPTVLAPGATIRLGTTILEVHGDLGITPAPAGSQTRGRIASRHDSTPVPVDQAGSPTSIGRAPRGVRDLQAVLVHRLDTVPIPPAGVAIGRDPASDIVVSTELASRAHARVGITDGRWYVADLGSVNGTYLNGELLLREARWLSPGDTITVGDEQIRFLVGADARGVDRPTLDPGVRLVPFESRLSLGRDAANDVCLDAPTISRFHAEVVASGGGLELRDLGSRNGTRLDGVLVGRAPLRAGSEISIGPFRLIFDGTSFIQRDDRGALRLDSYDVAVSVRDKTILQPTSLSMQPGELVTVIGESGSGKTTLLRVLAGVTRPSQGAVLVNGEGIAARLTDLGYLPQDEIVHPRLTVLESLRYSARLRLPPDATRDDIESAIARAIEGTGLQEHARTRIGSLSGGQRKRVGLATELLGSPGLLFLDEPTTGLDPGLETRMMELFRSLAEVGKHALLVVTHATKNLELADRLCIMGRGGIACFVGAPDDAKAFFGVRSFDDVYTVLEQRPADAWRREFEAAQPRPAQPPAPARHTSSQSRRQSGDRGPAGVGWVQSKVLTARYFRVFERDRRNLAIHLAQGPFLALAIGVLFATDIFAPAPRGSASPATQLLFILVVTMAWLGTISSAREIIKERAVFERERAVGVRVGPYVFSKLGVLAPLVAVQTVLLVLFVFGPHPLHMGAEAYLELTVVLALTGLVAVGMGLAISAFARTEEQATTLIPVAMILLLLFGGALVTVANMSTVVAAFSTLLFSRWAFAGVGAVVDMNSRIQADPVFSKSNPYGLEFFDVSLPVTILTLLAFLAVFTALTAALLAYRR
jgi:ABC-type multidrug transport system ATPase subunit/pSer/pThr/pTyr-binding forkhead associated (FHA) protein